MGLQRIFVVLKFWIERHRTDWSDEKLHSQLLGFMASTPEEYVASSHQLPPLRLPPL